MRILNLVAIFTLIPFALISQITVKTFDAATKVTYTLSNNDLSYKQESESKLNQKNRLHIRGISIQNGDLILLYDLFQFRKRERDMTMQMELFLEDHHTGQRIYAPPPFVRGDTEIKYNNTTQSPLRLVWEDWVETIKLESDSLKISLIGNLIDEKGIDCTKEPIWERKYKRTYKIAAGVGIGLFIAHFPVKSDSKNLEKAYYKDTFERNLNDASANYRTANNKHRTANLLRNTGIGIMAASLVSATIHSIIYKKHKKHFEYYCPRVSVIPTFQWQGQIDDNIGLSFNYSF